MENNPKLGLAAEGEEQEAAAKNSRIEQHGGNPASFSSNNNNNNNGGLLPERPQESAGTIGSGGGDSNNNEINNENGRTPAAAPAAAVAAAAAAVAALQQRQSSGSGNTRRTPFTNLSQVDADLALARTLQEQERAYMMLRMNNEGSDYGSWDAGSYYDDVEDDDDDDSEDEDDFGDPGDGTDGDDEVDNARVEEEGESDVDDHDDDVDAFDVHAREDVGENDDEEDDDEDNDDNDENAEVELDPAAFSSDEAYARALQDAEERELAARLLALAGITDGQHQDGEDYGANSQDTWEEVDPDELSYEELLALGEAVGTESRGLSADTIALLPSVKYKSGSNQSGSNDSCVICRLDYEDGETLTLLSCKHSYHSECINNWLKINKVCPVCSAEVTTSGHS